MEQHGTTGVTGITKHAEAIQRVKRANKMSEIRGSANQSDQLLSGFLIPTIFPESQIPDLAIG